MKTNIFRLLLLSVILSIGLTSCLDDDEFEGSGNFDINIETYTDGGGNFTGYGTQYYSGSMSNTTSIELQDTWIDVYSDFMPGDVVDLSIYINGVGTFNCPRYYINENINSFVIDNNNAPGFFYFMSRAMQTLPYNGGLTVTMTGYFNASNTSIDFSLKNNLNVYTSSY